MDALFPRIRQAVLGATLTQSGKWWYTSDLARHLGTSPSSLQRELAQLTAAGILVSRRDGNRAYFKAHTECPLFPELRRLVEKTSGLVDVLQQTVFPANAHRISTAFVFGSTARGEDDSASDVDLFVVGRVTAFSLTPKLQQAEKKLGRQINVTVFTPSEFAAKVAAGNHFIKSVLVSPKVFVIGNEHDLETAARGQRRAAARTDETRD